MKPQICLLVFCIIASALAWECEKGVPYKENACNTCRCVNNELACTFMACSGKQHDDMQKCEVGTKWKDDCNDCWCVAKYGTVCTANDC